MIKALIFDFDGLIIETEEPCYQAWQEIYQSFGVTLDRKLYLPPSGVHRIISTSATTWNNCSAIPSTERPCGSSAAAATGSWPTPSLCSPV